MKITIAGIGNAGTTVAADLTLKGHEVTLLKTSNSMHNDHFKHLLETKKVVINENGLQQIVSIHNVTDNFEAAFKDVELIIIYIQTNYHKQLIEKIIPYLNGGESILIEPGYLSTAFFIPYCKEKNLTIIEAESSPIDCRIINPGEVDVLFRNVRNPIGIYPSNKEIETMNMLSSLNYNFIKTNSVIEAALHNPNLIVHTIGAIMSIPRIEYTSGEYWMYKEVFTPSVWNIVEMLDSEKMDILSSLGYERISYVEACKFRNSEDRNKDALTVFFDYAQNSSPKGPSKVNSRYITEDVPEGLVLMESLGKILGVNTPTCSALIDIASAALKIPFRDIGRTVDKLNYDNIIKILNDKGGLEHGSYEDI